MIVKELDPLAPNASVQVQAGRRAEEQMAFYLRRAFAEDAATTVLNGLRVERQGEVAQIDHLLISTHGFILIESKSVTTKIRVNAQEEWSRQMGPTWKGMPSPLLQVERQAQLLRALLNDHVDHFFRKVLMIQFTFASVPFDGLVAISDSGVIQRPAGFAANQVLKADQITRRIQEMQLAYRRASGLFSLDLKNAGADFNAKMVTNLTQFLLQQHTPQSQTTSPSVTPEPLSKPADPRPQGITLPSSKPRIRPTPATVTPAVVAPEASGGALTHACRACGGHRLVIIYGKYGYYFKCVDCDGNTPIKVTCANGEKAKISKKGREFYVVCPDTPSPQLFYVNPAD